MNNGTDATSEDNGSKSVSEEVLIDALERQIKAIESMKGKKLTLQIAKSLVLIMKVVIVSITNRSKIMKNEEIYI